MTSRCRPSGQPEERPRPQLAPTPVFITGFVVTAHLHTIQPATLADAHVATLVGVPLMAVSAAVFIWSINLFAAAGTGILFHAPASALVARGPYRWSRNPQYVTFVGMYVGLALILNSLWPLVALPLVTLTVTRAVILPEEAYLRGTFGASYDAYCARVPRWL